MTPPNSLSPSVAASEKGGVRPQLVCKPFYQLIRYFVGMGRRISQKPIRRQENSLSQTVGIASGHLRNLVPVLRVEKEVVEELLLSELSKNWIRQSAPPELRLPRSLVFGSPDCRFGAIRPEESDFLSKTHRKFRALQKAEPVALYRSYLCGRPSSGLESQVVSPARVETQSTPSPPNSSCHTSMNSSIRSSKLS